MYLSGLGVRKRWYRQLWHVKYRPLPVRERSTNSDISTAQPVRCGDTLQLVLENLPITGERENFPPHFPLFFPLKSCQTLTANPFRNPPVSTIGSTQLIAVEANTQMKEMTIQAVKKPREKT